MATAKKATTKSKSERARERGPATFDRLQKKQARTKDVPIYLDDELAEEVERQARLTEQARIRWVRSKANRKPDERGLPEDALKEEYEDERKKLRDLRDELDAETLVMRFQALGRKRYEDLMAEHPPTDEQLEEAKEEDRNPPEFNTETFPAALVGASCVEPDLSDDAHWDEELERTRYPRAEEIFDTWNSGELSQIFAAAFEANTRGRNADLGKG